MPTHKNRQWKQKRKVFSFITNSNFEWGNKNLRGSRDDSSWHLIIKLFHFFFAFFCALAHVCHFYLCFIFHDFFFFCCLKKIFCLSWVFHRQYWHLTYLKIFSENNLNQVHRVLICNKFPFHEMRGKFFRWIEINYREHSVLDKF